MLTTARNPEGLFASWLRGYSRGCSTFKGEAARRAGEERLARALTCVDENGRRLRAFPRRIPARVLADIERAAVARERRELLGVTS